MYKNLLSWLTLLLALPSCSNTPPSISVVCEENSVGNCIIKWETAPLLKGQVLIYASTSPDKIPEITPIATSDIAAGTLTIVSSDPTRRYYYQMVFNNKYRVKVATRNINIPGIQNLRDLGGYRSLINGKKTRWGMLYRSARIDSLSPGSVMELHNMGIKTIVDLRTPAEQERHPAFRDDRINIVRIPLLADNTRSLLKAIHEGKVKSDTINRIIERRNWDIIANYQGEVKQIFELLLDPNNYPIVIHCTSGKGRTGIITALVLASLGVGEDVIMQDYRLSNRYFNIAQSSRYGYQLPPDLQEAITTFYSARADFLETILNLVEKQYGSATGYLKNAIGLTDEEIKDLRTLLLE
ncbi:MAG: tyrosine-protein phosphatase [Mediterranea sp.]|jgi:protein-tyrosine phosphatase|nr:tyrosine-protein phosphatase [Mediterranea sp.]